MDPHFMSPGDPKTPFYLSMLLQYEGIRIWVIGSDIKGIVGPQGPKITIFWLTPCSIGSYNGLVPARRQAIVWTNDA